MKKHLRRIFIAAAICGSLVSPAASQSYQPLYTFPAGNGSGPAVGLFQASDGNFYGTTFLGGDYDYGVIYKADSQGNIIPLHSFSGSDGEYPNGGFIQAADGNLYASTEMGGLYGGGTIFRIDLSGNFTVVHNFSGPDGGSPDAALMVASDGYFYGTTSLGGNSDKGTIFRMDTAGNVVVLYSFDGTGGSHPYSSLVQDSGGYLYGTTSSEGAGGAGTIFRADTSGNVNTLHAFSGPDGSTSYAGLLLASDGNFYGTTRFGGASGFGVVFEMDPGGATMTLHEFTGSDGDLPEAPLIEASDGFFYGTTMGSLIFKIDSSGNFTDMPNTSGQYVGVQPQAPLIQTADGSLYGTAWGGGPGEPSTILKMDLLGNYSLVASFGGYPLGSSPLASLLQTVDGYFYGTVRDGGAQNDGTIYRLDGSGNFTLLHSFKGSDGAHPTSALVQAPNGTFYGTTSAGGGADAGTIFAMDLAGNVTTLHEFLGSDGSGPNAALTPAPGGGFFGTTAAGGVNSDGTIFEVDVAGNLTTLHDFSGSDGASPMAELVGGAGGVYFGTTRDGGGNGDGVVFGMDAIGNVTVLHSFSGADGAHPNAALVEGLDGYLYGTTSAGGAGQDGTAFRMDSSGNVTVLHDFTGPEGADPEAGLVLASDGTFFGTAAGGGSNGYGTAFKLTSAGGFAIEHEFATTTGASPASRLIQGADLNFYGVTESGGWPQGGGILYRLTGCLDFSPVVTPSGPTEFCAGGSVTLDAGVGYSSYQWSPGGGSGEFLEVSVSGTYAVTVTDAIGCPGTSAPVVITVDPLPSPAITPSGPTTFCQGGSVTLDAGQGYASYLWSPGGETTQTIVVSASGSYSVTVTNANGCTATSPAVIVSARPYPAPVISVFRCLPSGSVGQTASVAANAGDTYAWMITGGTIDSGQGTNSISFTSGGPATLMTISVLETNTTGCAGSATDTMQVNFNDVSASNPFYNFICTIARNGITAGCGGGNYCPTASVLRSQMAVFLLRGEHGSAYVPPAATGIFGDVPASNPFAPWIEELYNESITGGCSTNPLLYCPSNAVSRAGMAVFLLVAEHGTGYVPPACTGIFTDVACPGPFTNFIEELYTEGITGGCNTNPLQYCPASSVTRAQMSVFLTVTFALP